MINFSTENKSLVLGTALWGWGVSRTEAFQLLEKFLELGGTVVDTATNYPINKNAADFGLAIKWIESWVSANPNSNLSLLAKIGSIDNSGEPHADLTPERIASTANRLADQFGHNLGCISLHWDNRGEHKDDLYAIEQTVGALEKIQQSGISIGLSGIKYPEKYFNASPSLADNWIIQAKENLTTCNARKSYEKFFPNAKYLAYGINLGGMSMDPAKRNSSATLRAITYSKSLIEQLSELLGSKHSLIPRPNTLNELALVGIYTTPAFSGVIIGPRNPEQLLGTIRYWNELKNISTMKIDPTFIARLKELSS